MRAEGERQAAVTRAEGEKTLRYACRRRKTSAILQAEAPPGSLALCRSESEAITRIAKAIGTGDPAQYLITARYIESLRDMTRSNNSKVIFMPVETSAMLSSIGAIKEVLSQVGEKGEDQPKPRQLP